MKTSEPVAVSRLRLPACLPDCRSGLASAKVTRPPIGGNRTLPWIRLIEVRTIVLLVTLLVSACGENAPPGSTGTGVVVSGIALAGPTCPVERNPPDPTCEDRPVPEAVGIIERRDGKEVARFTTGADGRFTVLLAAGSYRLIPQPVAGLLGTAVPIEFEAPITAPLTLLYDTGIR